MKFQAKGIGGEEACPKVWLGTKILQPDTGTACGYKYHDPLPNPLSSHASTKWLTEGVTDDPARRASEPPEKGMVELGDAEATPQRDAAIPER